MILLIENWNARNEISKSRSRKKSINVEDAIMLVAQEVSFRIDDNRFLNANKCHQSILIIMASWLIAGDFFTR